MMMIHILTLQLLLGIETGVMVLRSSCGTFLVHSDARPLFIKVGTPKTYRRGNVMVIEIQYKYIINNEGTDNTADPAERDQIRK